MATKSISTRISLVGEQEWRRSIDACRAALAEYKSEIALVNAQYKNNAMSLEGLMAKEKAQTNYIKELANLNDLYVQRQKELKTALEAQSKETERLTKELDFAERMLKIIEKDFSGNTELVQKYKDKVKDLSDELTASKEAEKNYSKELSRTNTQLNNNEKQTRAARAELDTTRTTLEALEDPTKRFGMTVADMSEEVQAAAVVLQSFVNKGLKELYDALAASAQASVQFEAAMTKVQKTTTMTDDELAVFGEQIKDLAVNIPITTDELAEVAEMAGQLGIASEDLLAFTKTMAMMGVSTNLSATEASTALAQIASVTGLTAEQYTNLASSIVAVGNNFATTEASVALMTQRIAGAASNAGMAESEMVGLATAVTSLGIGIDAGGTAIQSLINKLETAVSTGNNLETWAKVMGMTTEELATLWRVDAAGALMKLIGALGDADDSMIVTLKSLGISEQRLIRTVSLLANAEENTGLLTRAMDTANEAWATNTALQTEANKQFETTQSKITMFESSVNNLKIAIGDDLLPVIGKAAESGNLFVQAFTKFVEENPAITAAISGLVAGMGALAAITSAKAMAGLPAIAEALDAIKLAANAVLSPWGALLIAVSALGAAAVVAYNNMESYNKTAREWAKTSREIVSSTNETVAAIQQENDALFSQVAAMEALLAKEEKSDSEMAILTGMINDLNKAIPDLNAELNEQGNALVKVGTNAKISSKQLNAMAKALAEQAVAEEKLEALKQLYIDRMKYTEELTRLREKLREAEDKVNNAEERNLDNIQALEAEQNDLSAAIRTMEAALNAVNIAIDEYNKEVSEGRDVTSASLVETEKQLSAMQRSIEAYSNTKTAAVSAMSEIVGSFEKVSAASTMSYNTIMKNLQSQIDYMTNYSSNLDSLTSRNIKGVDEFAKHFMDGSQESANALASFAKMSDEQIAAIIEKYNEVPTTVEQWSDSMATASAGIHMSIEDMMKEFNRLQRKAKDTRDYLAYYGSGLTDEQIFDLIQSGKHAQGLEYVPYDDYAAMLHQGEMVLTRAEARAYRDEHSRGQSITNNTRNFGGVTLNVYSHKGQDIESLADEIMYRIEDATKRKESTWA